MSREAYQIPTAGGGGSSSAPGGGAGGGAGAGLTRTFDPDSVTMAYLCGDCGTKFPLRRSDPIRCKECGCRVLYKERTKRMVQFEAR